MKEMYKKIFYFSDLSEEAKEKAREWYRSINDYPFLEDCVESFISETMRAQKMTIVEGSLKVRYSLGYCQGDGVSFSCMFEADGKQYEAYTSGHHYMHENTMQVKELLEDYEEQDDEKMTEALRDIARGAEKDGYKMIEFEDSNECVDENIEANEYTFSTDGERMNPDN